MNILIIGSGGREHTIAWKLSQSKDIENLYTAPGNAGTELCSVNVNISPTNFKAIKDFVLQNKINMVVVGPEAPLVLGIHDYFLNDPELIDISVIGPEKAGALLEGSKDFAKDFMIKYNIPTARHQSFTIDTFDKGIEYLKNGQSPYVLKADGLAAGKGVLICDYLDIAIMEYEAMIKASKFGTASEKVVIENFLKGIELSVFIFTDGNDYLLMPPAKDYKRIGKNDTGLNTGGMGSVSGVPFADDGFMEKVERRIVIPTVNGLKKENIKYKGILYFGLMNVKGDPYLIEYNVRMGDPETEAVLPRINTDLLEIFKAIAYEYIGKMKLEIDERFAATVMAVSEGYPEAYEKGKVISGIDNVTNSIIFHAGTKRDNSNNIITNGGRVLAVTSYGNTMKDALNTSYQSINLITFEGKYYRKDIGWDLI